mmetsp:Transcript_9394/g.18600  ORF Transcript_9394/g.18600 Transcript_9394/m.18600 type:complete len:1185 (+) Transcript_9394:88-3642(+)
MNLVSSVVVLLLASVASANAQSSGCVSSTTALTLESQACSDSTVASAAEASVVGPASVDSCCPNLVADTEARRLLGLNSKALSGARSLQSADTCRIVETTNAYCDLDSDSGCEAENANLELAFTFSYETVTSDELCCAKCDCWGDPRCTAFDGSRDNWIICDDRRASNCQHGPTRCHKHRDPWGNRCEYVRRTRVPDSDDAQPWWYSWEQSGSPCQSTAIWEGTMFPTMVMYDGQDQVLNLTLGERGIIASVAVTEASGAIYTLTSEDCLSKSSASSWTSSDSSSIPDTWTVTVESDTRVRWNIQNDAATVYTTILCQATSDYRSRLDINLQIPTAGDSTNPDSEGFCATGSISEDSKGTGTLSISQDDMCLRSEVGSCVEACKALVDTTCLEENLEENVRYWCQMNDYTGVTPTINSTEECVSRIVMEENCNETAYNWADIVCQIDNMNSDKTSYDESGYQKCLGDIEDNTWFQYVMDRPTYTVVSSDSAPTECISDVTEYNTTKSSDCAVGVQVQSYDSSSDSWVDEFFIPVEYPPCNDLLNISGSDYPDLMTRPIRFIQCESIQAQCAVENSCLPTNGFEVEATYTMEFCPDVTLTPTPSPTVIIRGETCYECVESTESQQPQICVTESTYQELGTCDTCCEAASEETTPPLTEYGYCRSQETTRPYCNMSNSEEAAYCNELETSNGLLEIQIDYFDAEETPTNCCKDCAVYGDPEMTSFADTSLTLNISAWIICDGRSIKTNGDACPIEEDQCTQELDHDGNACYYNTTRANLLTDQSNIGAIGSPCQANPASGDATMELYTIPSGDFSINILLGERAVVTEARFTVSGDVYTLVSSDCFNDAGSGWTSDPTSVFTNVTYDSEDVRSTTRGAERTWSFLYDESIYVQITCIKMIAQGGDAQGITGYRMNIDHIIDTDLDRTEDSSATGYCPTDVVDYMNATVTDTSDGSVFNVCTWQQWSQALTLAKALVSTASTTAQIKEAVQTWCDTANVFQTYSDPASKCYSTIVGKSSDYSKIGSRWAIQYCNAINSNRGDLTATQWRNRCTSQIEEETFGIVNYVETYGTGAMDTDNTCSSNPTYSVSDNVCEQGIFVEYYDDDTSEWVEEFFIPALNMPCSGVVSASYSDHPNLFTNNIRFRQCDQQANNGCSLAFSCQSAQGYSVSYKYSQDSSVCSGSGGSS